MVYYSDGNSAQRSQWGKGSLLSSHLAMHMGLTFAHKPMSAPTKQVPIHSYLHVLAGDRRHASIKYTACTQELS